jgi:hypothetical protein
MRTDPFRNGRPAFTLCKELADLESEQAVADDADCDQDTWCQRHHELVQRRIREVGDGWEAAAKYQQDQDFQAYWKGIPEQEWLQRAHEEMKTIYRSVRRKGRLGGVFRRQFYRQPFEDFGRFQRAVCAMQAVTERLAQSSLSIKTDEAQRDFPADRFFADPGAPECEGWLGELDETLSYPAIRAALGTPVEPAGLLAWMAKPTFENLVAQLAAPQIEPNRDDPRIAWFLG